VGRKYTFLVTIMVMGAATFLVGLLPTFGAHTVSGIGAVAGIGWLAQRADGDRRSRNLSAQRTWNIPTPCIRRGTR
jgi:hypothetical protein